MFVTLRCISASDPRSLFGFWDVQKEKDQKKYVAWE